MSVEIDLDALEAKARAQIAAIDQMYEVGIGVGGMTPDNFAAFQQWQASTEGNDHADTVLALIERLRVAEGAAFPGGCIYCHSSGVIEDFDGVNQPCSACGGTGTPPVATIYRDLIDSLSHVDESTDPILLATRVLACLKGDPNWESVEVGS